MTDTLAFALAAGTLAALNPCGFAMLPAYLTLFIAPPGSGSGETAARPDSAVLRALTATAAMTGGFVAVFATFGLLLVPVASSVQQWLPAVTVLIGLGLLAMGAVLLTGRDIVLATPKLGLRGNPADSVRAMAFYGVAYAIASLGCTIGPFLAVTASTFRGGSVAGGVAAYAAYAAGMGLVVGVLAVATALAQQPVAGLLRTVGRHVNRASGALLLVVGAYVAYYGGYELRVASGDAAADPVVDAAGRIQGALAGVLDTVGPARLALAGAVLLAVVLAAAWSRRASGAQAKPVAAGNISTTR